MIVNLKHIKRNYAKNKEYMFVTDEKTRHETNTN